MFGVIEYTYSSAELQSVYFITPNSVSVFYNPKQLTGLHRWRWRAILHFPHYQIVSCHSWDTCWRRGVLLLCRVTVRLPASNKCPSYDIKQSDIEGNAEQPFITMTFLVPSGWSGSTWSGPIYGSNRTVWHLNCANKWLIRSWNL